MSGADDDGLKTEAFDITVDAASHPAARARSSGRDATANPRALVAVIAAFVLVFIAGAAWLSLDRTEVPELATPAPPIPATVTPTGPAVGPTLAPLAPPGPTTTTRAPDLASPRDTPVAFVPWPPPPKDHDPTVSGRPASLPRDLAPGLTILYVNDLGRPTLLGLANGDRWEVAIADTRLEDVFLIDQGHVVTRQPGRSTLRQASDRAIEVSMHRAGRDPAAMPMAQSPGPQLCLGSGGCPELRWTTGSFGTDENKIESIPAPDPVTAISELLGALSWVPGPRWTTLRLAGFAEAFVVPTPLAGATVWLVTQVDTTP